MVVQTSRFPRSAPRWLAAYSTVPPVISQAHSEGSGVVKPEISKQRFPLRPRSSQFLASSFTS